MWQLHGLQFGFMCGTAESRPGPLILNIACTMIAGTSEHGYPSLWPQPEEVSTKVRGLNCMSRFNYFPKYPPPLHLVTKQSPAVHPWALQGTSFRAPVSRSTHSGPGLVVLACTINAVGGDGHGCIFFVLRNMHTQGGRAIPVDGCRATA